MTSYVVAVRLGGVKPTAVELIADRMGEGLCSRVVAVEILDPPDGWQAELHVLVRDEMDLPGAIGYMGLVTRRAIREAKTPVSRIAIAATRD